MNNKPKIILHTCCACCLAGVIENLTEFIPLIFYYNPNIYPEAEYKKRLQEVIKVAKLYGLELIEGAKDFQAWTLYIKGFENEKEGGERCKLCFRLRMKKTKEKAKQLNINYATTTLTISPYKNFKIIKAISEGLNDNGFNFIVYDFKKKEGYLKSIKESKRLGLYRQHYCGCVYSLRDNNNEK
ncbi:MAG: epoxyqueuosine reductase QueH [Candidatus Hydrogenedentota bacterium]